MPREGPSPASSGDTTTTFSNDQPSPPSSPSFSIDSAPESHASSSSSVLSDGSTGSEPVAAKVRPKRVLGVRKWQAAADLAVLEVVLEQRQKNDGQLPSRRHLVAALRGRLQSVDRVEDMQIGKHLWSLRARYKDTVRRLSVATLPVTDDDLRIYKLPKLIWGDCPTTGKKKVRAPEGRQDPRAHAELARLYPCLAAEVDAIEAGCTVAAATKGVLKRAFTRIGDDTAERLEANLKRQRMAEARASAELGRLRRNVTTMLLNLSSE